ncbi:MAG: Crp/Fnr family transcriptional regulator [Spirochaetales bacterium]|nr:Crp/Fnr family transcriptional regulator [Spirochaetales bacterium]
MKDETILFLKSVPLFSSLNNKEIETLADNSRTITYEKGDYIFKKSAFPNAVYIIMKGIVKEIVIDSNDFETVVKNRRVHDYIGEIGVLLQEPYVSTAIATNSVELLEIPREFFCHLTYNHVKITKFIIKTLCLRLQNSAETHLSFLMFNSEGRIAYRILMLSRELERNANKIETTQETLSQMCGVARQTLSNILGGWKKDGIILTHRGYIEILNKEELVEVFLGNTIIR